MSFHLMNLTVKIQLDKYYQSFLRFFCEMFVEDLILMIKGRLLMDHLEVYVTFWYFRTLSGSEILGRMCFW